MSRHRPDTAPAPQSDGHTRHKLQLRQNKESHTPANAKRMTMPLLPTISSCTMQKGKRRRAFSKDAARLQHWYTTGRPARAAAGLQCTAAGSHCIASAASSESPSQCSLSSRACPAYVAHAGQVGQGRGTAAGFSCRQGIWCTPRQLSKRTWRMPARLNKANQRGANGADKQRTKLNLNLRGACGAGWTAGR